MKRKRSKDLIRRQIFNKLEIYQRLLKVLIVFSSFGLLYKVLKKKVSVYRTQLRNFCILTKRSRGVYRHLKVSRICLKNLGSNFFFGIKKAS